MIVKEVHMRSDIAAGIVMTEILGGLAVNGKLVVVGASDEPIQVPPFLLILGRRSIVGCHLVPPSTPKTHSHLMFFWCKVYE